MANGHLCAGLRVAPGKITVSGISYRLTYCVIFIVNTQFPNVAVGRLIPSDGPRVRDLWFLWLHTRFPALTSTTSQ